MFFSPSTCSGSPGWRYTDHLHPQLHSCPPGYQRLSIFSPHHHDSEAKRLPLDGHRLHLQTVTSGCFQTACHGDDWWFSFLVQILTEATVGAGMGSHGVHPQCDLGAWVAVRRGSGEHGPPWEAWHFIHKFIGSFQSCMWVSLDTWQPVSKI